MRPTFNQLKKNSGQATVEYILLLVVVVALVLGPLRQFSQFFNGYVEALFGNGQYFSCLLETGELGGQSTDAGSTCSAAFKASVQTALSNSQNGSSSGKGGSSQNTSSSNGQNQSSNDNSSSSSSSSSGSSTKSSSSNQASSSTAPSSSDSGGGGSGDNFSNAGLSGGANHNNRSPSRQVVNSGAGKDTDGGDSYVKLGGGDGYDYQALRPNKGFEVAINKLDKRFSQGNEESKRVDKLSPKEVASTNTRNLRNKELSFDPPRAPASKDDDSNSEGFGFSMLLKWFLIFGILIAVIIVVGGQALQISKGGDN